MGLPNSERQPPPQFGLRVHMAAEYNVALLLTEGEIRAMSWYTGDPAECKDCTKSCVVDLAREDTDNYL